MKRKQCFSTILLLAFMSNLSLVFVGNAIGQESIPSAKKITEESPKDPKVEDSKGNQEGASTDWGRFGFGLALTYTQDLGSHDRVKRASLDANGKVRVEEENNALPRVMLETHYFFQPDYFLMKGCGGPEIVFDENGNPMKRHYWGHGPFIAAQFGSDQIVEAVAAGWMVGWRRGSGNGFTKDSSFNIGLGVVIDPKVQVLGDGIKENKTLPAGETQIRYKDTHQVGLLLISSFSF